MSKNEDKEEIKRRNKIEIIKFLAKFWDIRQNILPEGMPQKIVFSKRKIKQLMNVLLGENTEEKEKLINLRKKKLKRSSSTGDKNILSSIVTKMISKIGRNTDKIHNTMTDITRMNGLFLEKKERTTFSTHRTEKNKKNNLEKLDLKKEYILDNMNKNNENNADIYNTTRRQNKKIKIKKFNILSETNKNEKEMEKSKTENYMKNFIFVNENYRKQLNFAFLKYNPDQHLKNLKILVQAEPLIRKDLALIKKEVEQDIKWRCDKYHFKKKYEMIKKRFERSNSVQSTPKGQINKRNILPNLNKKKSIKIFTPILTQKKIKNIYEKKIEEENAKYTFRKEEKLEEIKHMLKASSEIDNLIKNENINKKIDMYKTNYEEKLKLNEFYDTNSINLLEKDYFEEEKKNVINKLGDLYQFQIAKNTEEKESKLKGKIYKDNDDFNQKLIEEKAETINEINDILNDYDAL